MGNTEKFDMIADIYDTPERVHIARVSSDAIRECLSGAQNKSAIDFGCGTGLVGIKLLSEFRTMLFLDTSQNMLDQVKMKIQNAQTMCYDFEKDCLVNLHADYIFMAQVLLHIQDFETVLRKLYDVLNPEGHLIIVDFDQNDQVVSDMVHNGFRQEELSSIMSGIGFKSIRARTFYRGSKLFMGQDASMFILDSQK